MIDPRVLAFGEENMLTTHKMQVLSQLIQGYPNKLIAQHLGISEQSVKNALRDVFAKVRVKNRTELTLMILSTELQVQPEKEANAKEPGFNSTAGGSSER